MGNKKLLNQLQEDIENTRKELMKLNLLLETRPIETKNGRDKTVLLSYKSSGVSENYSYDENINCSELMNKLMENQQFGFLLYDKSIIQYAFTVKNGEIIKERLFFIKKHNKHWSQEEISNLENTNETWFEDDDSGFPIVFRIDFDKENSKPIEHPQVHFTISNHQCCRIPMKTILPVSKFINFILVNFYKTKMAQEGNFLFPDTIHNSEKNLIHFYW